MEVFYPVCACACGCVLLLTLLKGRCVFTGQNAAMQFIMKHGKSDKDIHNLRQEIEEVRFVSVAERGCVAAWRSEGNKIQTPGGLSFDKEKEITNIRIPHLEMTCKDLKACKWSRELLNGDISLAWYFDAMNEKSQNVIKEIWNTCSQIITFSHFVPSFATTKEMLARIPKL